MQRERLILATAIELIDEKNLSSLTMDAVSSALGIPKGTLYGHYTCKEDLILSLGNQALSELQRLFIPMLSSPCSSRSLYLAFTHVYIRFAQRNPALFLAFICSKTPLISHRASIKQHQRQQELETKLYGLLSQIIDKGLRNGELILGNFMNKTQLCFIGWSGIFGASILFNQPNSKSFYAVTDIGFEEAILSISNNFLDGINWFPLSTDELSQELNSDLEKKISKLDLSISINI